MLVFHVFPAKILFSRKQRECVLDFNYITVINYTWQIYQEIHSVHYTCRLGGLLYCNYKKRLIIYENPFILWFKGVLNARYVKQVFGI